MSLRPLTPELAELARRELNEDPTRVTADLQHIKDWIAKQPHLRARTDDQWLIAFLRGSKFSLERAKEKIDLFYTVRTTAPEFFILKHNDSRFLEILDTGVTLVLPKTAYPGAPRVTLVRPGVCDPDKFPFMDLISVSKILEKIIFMEDDNTIVAGSVVVLDLEGASMKHFLQVSPTQTKKMIVFNQEAAPIRMKGTHYLNTPTGFETIFNAMKGMLNKKNQERLFVHNKDYEAMYKHIPKEILPVEYGGSGGTIQEIKDYWKKKVVEYAAFLEEDQNYGTDESKRLGKPKTAEDMFGVDGSFRQLDFD